MTKLVCSGCGRSVDITEFHGDEVCKECNKPMKKVTGETSTQEVVKEESKIVLPTTTNLCGELPNFADKQII